MFMSSSLHDESESEPVQQPHFIVLFVAYPRGISDPYLTRIARVGKHKNNPRTKVRTTGGVSGFPCGSFHRLNGCVIGL